MQKSDGLSSCVRSCVYSKRFREENRTKKTAFIRERKLTFPRVLLFLIQKSVKPLQIALNELFGRLDDACLSVSASAFCQARQKLSHTAFIELNKGGVVDVMYGDGDYQRWHGFRVLAVDGSQVILPDSPSVREEFGSIRIANQQAWVAGERCYGVASVLYDVLNRVVLDSVLAPARAYEVDLAIDQPPKISCSSRNYPSYRYLATLVQEGIPFVGRCSNRSFAPARKMFGPTRKSSCIATLRPPHDKKRQIGPR